MRDRTKSLYDFAIHQVQFSANLINTASAVLFLYPPPPNFAKTHTRLGRGRLAVGCRDLIPPWGYTRCAGVACRGSGLCRVGVLPGAGMGVPDGGGTPGRGAVPGQACRGWRRCARAASLPGRVVFPGRRREKLFSKRPYAHVYGSRRPGFGKIGG